MQARLSACSRRSASNPLRIRGQAPTLCQPVLPRRLRAVSFFEDASALPRWWPCTWPTFLSRPLSSSSLQIRVSCATKDLQSLGLHEMKFRGKDHHLWRTSKRLRRKSIHSCSFDELISCPDSRKSHY